MIYKKKTFSGLKSSLFEIFVRKLKAKFIYMIIDNKRV